MSVARRRSRREFLRSMTAAALTAGAGLSARGQAMAAAAAESKGLGVLRQLTEAL